MKIAKSKNIINAFIIKLIAISVCVCTIVSAFSGCNKKVEVVRVPLSSLPNYFDPQIANTLDLENILNNCFEGLVRVSPSGNIVKGVAESWDISSDKMTYTFHLNNKAKWHLPKGLDDILGEDYEKTFDNRVTAHDFEFALKRAVDPNTASPMANMLIAISGAEEIINGTNSKESLGVESLNDTTLVIHLARPSVSFLSVLASPVGMPCNKEFFEATVGRYGLEPELTLCNGPYFIKLVDEDAGVTINKNEDYKGHSTAIADKVKFLFPKAMVKSPTSEDEDINIPPISQLMLLDEGGYDVGSVSLSESKSLESIAEINRYKNTIKLLCFNQSSAKLKDQNLRLAFMYATDIDLLKGNMPKAEGIIPSCCELAPGVSYRANSNIISMPSFSMKKAEELMNTAINAYMAESESSTFYLPINLICLETDEHAIKSVMQNWQKLFGTSLSVTITTFKTQGELNQELTGGNYDIAYTNITSSEYLAPDFLNRFSTKSGSNIVNLHSDEYDSLLDKIYNAENENELLSATKQAEEYLVAKAALLPINEDNSYLAIKKNVSEITVRPSGTVYALYTLN